MPLPLPLGLGLALGLVWASAGGASSSLLSKQGFFLGAFGGGGVGFGGLGGSVLSPPLVVVVVVVVVVVLLLLLLVVVVVSPARSYTLTQPLRRGSMPPALLPAFYLPKPSSTERAKLVSVPIIRPNSVTSTRCVRPPPSRHSTRTPRGSAPHVCTLTTLEKKHEASVF